MHLIHIGLLGYATSLSGLLLALIFSVNATKFSNRFIGILNGFTGGVLIAFVCFGLLPDAFESDGLFFGIFGIIAGACAAMAIESKVDLGGDNKIGIVTALGVALHNIPEGIALGSALNANFIVGLSLCPIIALHCFPEALAVLIPLRKSKALSRLLLLCLFLAAPMGLSSLIGAAINNLSHVFVSICASFAGGVMIYITCGDIIPGSKKKWNGRMTTLGAVFGFVIGVLLTSI